MGAELERFQLLNENYWGGGGGVILVTIPHTCTESHKLAVITFNILPILVQENTSKLLPKTKFLLNFQICIYRKVMDLGGCKFRRKCVFRLIGEGDIVGGDRSVAGEVQVIIRQPGEKCQEPPPVPRQK
jgi:hypothetical protein